MTSTDEALLRAAAPVHAALPVAPDEKAAVDQPDPGVGLCLSGGGYRAMLFHLGALWRLNELGYLPKLVRVSSVSGGSITAGVLASRWSALSFEAEIVAPLRELAGQTIDLWAIVLGLFLPGSIGNRVAASYRRRLFGETTLQDLPKRPRFVFNTTNLQSGALMRLSKPYAWDWRVGEVPNPTVELAVAVAASAAFPPFLSPVVLRFEAGDFVPGSGADLEEEAYRRRVVLSDGGVYDNLGLETVWKNLETVLVSDGGGKLSAKARPRHVWPLQLYRVLGVIDNQVRSLRKRQVIDGLKARLRTGTYWGIRGHIEDYALADPLPFPPEETTQLANVKTRLGRMDADLQEALIDWGYAICDTAMRRHVAPAAARPSRFPYRQS